MFYFVALEQGRNFKFQSQIKKNGNDMSNDMSHVRLSSWYDFRDNNENRPGYVIEHRVLFKYHSPPTPRYGERPKTLEELLNLDIPENVKLVCIKDCILLSKKQKLKIIKEYSQKFLFHYQQLLNTCKLEILKK